MIIVEVEWMNRASHHIFSSPLPVGLGADTSSQCRRSRSGLAANLAPLAGRGRIASSDAIRVSDYLDCQVALAYSARASRAFALSLTRSLRAKAMRTTIFCLPALSSLSRNSPRLLSYRAAMAATRKRIERTPARPPRVDRLPFRLPLSLAIGARPAS